MRHSTIVMATLATPVSTSHRLSTASTVWWPGVMETARMRPRPLTTRPRLPRRDRATGYGISGRRRITTGPDTGGAACSRRPTRAGRAGYRRCTACFSSRLSLRGRGRPLRRPRSRVLAVAVRAVDGSRVGGSLLVGDVRRVVVLALDGFGAGLVRARHRTGGFLRVAGTG